MEATYKVAVYDKGCRPNEGPALGSGPIVTHQGDLLHPRIDGTEPLVRQAHHFLDCIHGRARPVADGESGARVVSILEHGQRSLETGTVVPIPPLPFGAAAAPAA
jgi:predicted dehydrogenase